MAREIACSLNAGSLGAFLAAIPEATQHQAGTGGVTEERRPRHRAQITPAACRMPPRLDPRFL
jgi:hypothetical protein